MTACQCCSVPGHAGADTAPGLMDDPLRCPTRPRPPAAPVPTFERLPQSARQATAWWTSGPPARPPGVAAPGHQAVLVADKPASLPDSQLRGASLEVAGAPSSPSTAVEPYRALALAS